MTEMREIKFRAWDNHNKVMLTYEKGYLLQLQLDGKGQVSWKLIDRQSMCQVLSSWDTDSEGKAVNNILMQYTGLKDKDGKELDWWEDDLLRKGSDHPNAPIGKIMYDEWMAKWSIVSKGYERGKSTEFCGLAQAYMNGWKKVGDIHTTPELLKKK